MGDEIETMNTEYLIARLMDTYGDARVARAKSFNEDDCRPHFDQAFKEQAELLRRFAALEAENASLRCKMDSAQQLVCRLHDFSMNQLRWAGQADDVIEWCEQAQADSKRWLEQNGRQDWTKEAPGHDE